MKEIKVFLMSLGLIGASLFSATATAAAAIYRDVNISTRCEKDAYGTFTAVSKTSVIKTVKNMPDIPEYGAMNTVFMHESIADSRFNIFFDSRTGLSCEQAKALAVKMQKAYKVYNEEFGLRHPHKSPRATNMNHPINLYGKLQTDGINVFVFQSLSPPGFAYDVVPKIEIRGDVAKALRSIPYYTPEHEVFHLFQAGYAISKSLVFHEGTAEWATYAWRHISGAGADVQGWATISGNYDPTLYKSTGLSGVKFMRDYLTSVAAMDISSGLKHTSPPGPKKSTAQNSKLLTALNNVNRFGKGVSLANIEILFDYAEANFHTTFSPHKQSKFHTLSGDLYYVRDYGSTSNKYLAVREDGQVFIKRGATSPVESLGTLVNVFNAVFPHGAPN